MHISIIVCAARNGTIGRGGAMPWRMPSDLKHFKQTTLGKPVVMGRKTFQSIGKPLPGRTNFLITRQANLAIDGVVVVSSLAEAIAAAAGTGADEIMILGGGEIYAQALPLADRVYLTELAADIEGDTAFARLDSSRWQVVSRVPLATGPKDDYAAQVIVYERCV